MSSHPGTTNVIKPGRSESPFLLFTGNRKQFGSFAREIFTDLLLPLLIGIAAALVFLLLYAFFKGKLG
jgi:hypothetical protein